MFNITLQGENVGQNKVQLKVGIEEKKCNFKRIENCFFWDSDY